MRILARLLVLLCFLPLNLYAQRIEKIEYETSVYEGQVVGLTNLIRHGLGKMTWVNGNTYVGEYRDGVRNGQGTYTWANGNTYVGEHRDGKLTGYGMVKLASGKTITGTWLNSLIVDVESVSGVTLLDKLQTSIDFFEAVGLFDENEFSRVKAALLQ